MSSPIPSVAAWLLENSSTSPVPDATDLAQNVLEDSQAMAGGSHGGLLSNKQTQDIEMVLCGIRFPIAILGVFTNLANIVVLSVQGLKDTVNVVLFMLSLSDLAYVVSVLPKEAFCFHLNADNVLAHNVKQASIPQGVMLGIAFSRISSALTALIAAQRCICVVFPLKVHRIVTFRCTMFTIIAIFVVLFALFVPVLMLFEVQYFDVGSNITMGFAVPTQFYMDNFRFLSVFADTVVSVVIPLSLLAVVTVCTTLTVLRLKLSSRWRQSVSTTKSISSTKAEENASKNTTSESDEKTARLTSMMVAIACVYIVCIIPGTVSTLVRLFIPEFNLNKRYNNLFLAVYALDFTMQTANSSVNFFVYTAMSSRFRAVFVRLVRQVCCRRRQPANGPRLVANTQCSTLNIERSGVSISTEDK